MEPIKVGKSNYVTVREKMSDGSLGKELGPDKFTLTSSDDNVASFSMGADGVSVVVNGVSAGTVVASAVLDSDTSIVGEKEISVVLEAEDLTVVGLDIEIGSEVGS